MESMIRRNAVARAVVLWLFDEDENYPVVEAFLEQAAALVGDEQVSHDELIRTVRWLDDRGIIDGPRIDQAPYPVRLRLTAAGRIIATEQDGWIQPEVVPDRAITEQPVVSIARAFLRWLYDRDHEQPMPQKFLNDNRSVIAAHQTTDAEMTEAVELLLARGSDLRNRLVRTRCGLGFRWATRRRKSV